MRYLVRTVPERIAWLKELRAQIPQLEVIRDRTRVAFNTFLEALAICGTDPAVHLEDDIVLTSGFVVKIEREIAARPDRLIQFFSRRKEDPARGSREMPGSGFSFNCCFYLPSGYAAALRDYGLRWPKRQANPGGYDWMMGDWMKARGERYWLHVPSLVQHRVSPSIIDPRRAQRRVSATFQP